MTPRRGADQASGRDTIPTPTLAQTIADLRRDSDSSDETLTNILAGASSVPLPTTPIPSSEITVVLAEPSYETVRDSNGNQKQRLALPALSSIDTTTTTTDQFVSPVDSENSEDGIVIFRGSDRVDPVASGTVNHGGQSHTIDNTDYEPRFCSRLGVNKAFPSKPAGPRRSTNLFPAHGVSVVDFQFSNRGPSSTTRAGARSPSITELPYPVPFVVPAPGPRRAPREQFDIEAQTARARKDSEQFWKILGFVFCNPRPMSTRGKKFFNAYNTVMWLHVLVFLICVFVGISQGSIVLK